VTTDLGFEGAEAQEVAAILQRESLTLDLIKDLSDSELDQSLRPLFNNKHFKHIKSAIRFYKNENPTTIVLKNSGLQNNGECVRVFHELQERGIDEHNFLNMSDEDLTAKMSSSNLPAGNRHRVLRARKSFINKDAKKDTKQEEKSNLIGSLRRQHIIPVSNVKKMEMLGKGASGIVFRGSWDGSIVAVKELQDVSRRNVKELVVEAEMMSRLRHPNVCRFFGITNDTSCLVVEYCSNGTLLSFLKKHPFQSKRDLKMALKIAAGLNYLHDSNTVHCDLKSLNVLLDDSLEPKISDFGLSKIKTVNSNSINSSNNRAVGTYRWFSPEMLQGKSNDKKSDMWSFGMILYELVTRSMPYADFNESEMVIKISNYLVPDFPADTPAILVETAKGCWKIPETRWTITQVVSSLQRAVGDDVTDRYKDNVKENLKDTAAEYFSNSDKM